MTHPGTSAGVWRPGRRRVQVCAARALLQLRFQRTAPVYVSAASESTMRHTRAPDTNCTLREAQPGLQLEFEFELASFDSSPSAQTGPETRPIGRTR